MLLKILIVGALAIGVMAAIRDGRVLRDAGLLSSCNSVTVNGQDAKLNVIQGGVVDWTALVPAPSDGQVVAAAMDEAGNRETLTHVMVVGEGR